MADDKLELIEGVFMNEQGVGPATISARTTSDFVGLGPGIVYQPLDMPPVGNGGVLQWRHAISLCGTCGRPEGICEC
jgi:hypothetical protein